MLQLAPVIIGPALPYGSMLQMLKHCFDNKKIIDTAHSFSSFLSFFGYSLIRTLDDVQIRIHVLKGNEFDQMFSNNLQCTFSSQRPNLQYGLISHNSNDSLYIACFFMHDLFVTMQQMMI